VISYDLSNCLRITGLPPNLEEYFKSVCTYDITPYANKDKGIPEKLHLFKKEGNSIYIPRGKELELIRVCSQNNLPVTKTFSTSSGENVPSSISEKINYTSGVFGFQGDAVNKLLQYNTARIQAPPGCHAPGTEILMYNGTLKKVEKIQIGDLLMGPDSKPREVLKLFSGEEEMYKITPTKGTPFVVNKSHVLHLEQSGIRREDPQPKILKGVDMCKYIKLKGTTINISVNDYLDKSNSFKHHYKLKRAAINFKELPTSLPIDPYHLGVLLGDGGICRQGSITTADEEIVKMFNDLCRQHCLIQNSIQDANTGKAKTYFFKSSLKGIKTGIPGHNLLIDRLKNLNLWGTKSGTRFIPEIYKKASNSERLKILAGLIDTDGYFGNGNFEYVSKSERLADDITFIARSLGLAAYKNIKIVNQVEYYRLSISGEVSIIPTRIKRKQAVPRKQKKSVLRTGFKVESVGEGSYYGFMLNKDHLYLTEDFTVHHNSGKTVISCIAMALLGKGPVLFLAQKDRLLTQFRRTVTKVLGIPDEEIGIIKAKKKIIKPITCGSLMTLGKEGFDLDSLKDTFHTIFFDECHLSTALTYRTVLLKLAPERLYGLSATPEHYSSDELSNLMTALLGEIVVTIHENQIPGRLTPETYTRETGNTFFYDVTDSMEEWRKRKKMHKLQDEVCNNEVRNNLIVDDCVRLISMGFKPIICTARVLHAKIIYEKLLERGIHISYPYTIKTTDKGAIQTKVNHKQLNEDVFKVESGELAGIGGTYTLFDTGFDCPSLSALILAGPFSGGNTTRIEQTVGRVLRFTVEKKYAVVIDYTDDSNPNNKLRDWSEGRKEFYEKKYSKHSKI